MTVSQDRFWAKVLFKEFIRHYRKLTNEQIVADVLQSMDDLEDLVEDSGSFGSKMVRWSIERADEPAAIARRENGKKGGRPKKSPQDAPNGNAGVDMYDAGNGAASKSPTSCDTLTADGDTREDSQAKPDGSAITRNETRHIDALDSSANHYATRQAKNGEAATREGAEAFNRRESGAVAPSTFSNNMRQPAKTRDNSASCRYAPPSCSPEDGNHYDQDTSISTDNPQPEGLTGPTAGGSCVEISDAATTPCASTISTNPSQEAPTRKAGDELTESGNGSLRNTPPSCEEHLDEDRQSQRTGAAPERVKNQPSSHCGKAPVRSFGESGLVHMTDAQANSLRSYYGEDFDRAVGILENYILSLPSKAEGDEKCEAKFWREDYAKRNHYFVMRRDNWVDNALKKAKTADKRLENASNPNYKSFKQQDLDARTEFFSKSIFDGKEAI